VVAVFLGGQAVNLLRGVFGSDEIFSATGSSAAPLEPSYLKRVTYEVDGPSGTTGNVSYLNKNAQPEEANFTSLPWSYTITTTAPAVIANVVAQGNSDSPTTATGSVARARYSRLHRATATASDAVSPSTVRSKTNNSRTGTTLKPRAW
jgi:hypothetical protein